MTRIDPRFDRVLPGLFDELADARTPDYLEAAIERASSRPQRPAWTFPGRWLPMEITTRGRAGRPDAVAPARRPRPHRHPRRRGRSSPTSAPPQRPAGAAVRPGRERRHRAREGRRHRRRRSARWRHSVRWWPVRRTINSPMFSPDGTRLAFLR